MKNHPTISAPRAALVFKEMVDCRRGFRADNEFFKMPELLDFLFDDHGMWRINTYRSKETEDYKRKAGVIAFGDSVTITIDEILLRKAKDGCKLSNFILAHELGHVALDHHRRGLVTKHFQLFRTQSGMSNVPPTSEELETNYAAVFLQCGIALFDERLTALELAHRAFSDVGYVEKAQRLVRLPAFRRELSKLTKKYPRIVL
ncbi:M48 family metalloprotease [Tabrizicola sp. J26]|uniref:M48 family metalloprotease n=1 Tax=Alitabrizicola rongguiensis TaxID=2909234 RepID=UPI001F34C768|nr:M48 family metalloprotease [Tabrizicola rongguiensis]MCF1709712.1 M48 family metalloprotease [Tabrizicola rongguiensis]